jgi:hypothetical protein
MTTAYSISSYANANTQPTATADELKLWWARDTVSTQYYPYRVKVENRQVSGNLDILSFRLARNELLGPFEVDLVMQHAHVWRDLPSTAQLVTDRHRTENPPRVYGFLMLSEAWETAANARLAQLAQAADGFSVAGYREAGEKWPFSAQFAQALSAELRDDPMRARLLGLYDIITRSVA